MSPTVTAPITAAVTIQKLSFWALDCQRKSSKKSSQAFNLRGVAPNRERR